MDKLIGEIVEIMNSIKYKPHWGKPAKRNSGVLMCAEDIERLSKALASHINKDYIKKETVDKDKKRKKELRLAECAICPWSFKKREGKIKCDWDGLEPQSCDKIKECGYWEA